MSQLHCALIAQSKADLPSPTVFEEVLYASIFMVAAFVFALLLFRTTFYERVARVLPPARILFKAMPPKSPRSWPWLIGPVGVFLVGLFLLINALTRM